MTFPKPEVITALATVIYAVISAFLWRATKRAADLTQAMLEASNRPFLGISVEWDFSGSYDPEDHTPRPRVFFTIKNYGPGSAKRVTGKLRVSQNENEWSKTIAPIYLPPLQSEEFSFYFGDIALARSMGPRSNLDVVADFRYEGFHSREYHHYEAAKHNPIINPATKEVTEVRVT